MQWRTSGEATRLKEVYRVIRVALQGEVGRHISHDECELEPVAREAAQHGLRGHAGQRPDHEVGIRSVGVQADLAPYGHRLDADEPLAHEALDGRQILRIYGAIDRVRARRGVLVVHGHFDRRPIEGREAVAVAARLSLSRTISDQRDTGAAPWGAHACGEGCSKMAGWPSLRVRRRRAGAAPP